MLRLFYSLLLAFLAAVHARDAISRQDHHQLSKRTTYTKKYTSLVVFGASYQDNAHPRAEQYKQYQRGWPYAGGRFTNGPVMVEYLRSSLKVPLLDYAYGGSVVVNDNIASAATPAVSDQVSQYLSEISTGNVASRGKGRAMHVFWAGINDVTQIWNGWRTTGNTDAAMKDVLTHANRLIVEAKRVQDGAASNRAISNADLMILSLPPLEMTPNIKAQSSKASDLAFMKKLTDSYNSALNKGIKSLQTSGKGKSRVVTFDMQKWWKSTIAKPASIGVKNVNQPCYNSSTGSVCSNPSDFFYYDTLHPTTTTFKQLAKQVVKVI